MLLFFASQFHLEHSKDSFGLRSHGIIETISPGKTKFYPLPQSTREEYRRARAQDIKEFRAAPERSPDSREVIGPHQTEVDKIWFGNNFYDGEGLNGVGAFGYFDEATRKYTLYSPPEVARCEVSAILVQPDAVWLGLDHFGEDISTFPCGLVRWDRMAQTAKNFPLEFVISSIRTEGDSLRLETHDGYALFHEGTLHRFLNNGKPVTKFNPPPTHY